MVVIGYLYSFYFYLVVNSVLNLKHSKSLKKLIFIILSSRMVLIIASI